MRFLSDRPPSPAWALAVDEALLADREAGRNTYEVLRVWAAQGSHVVLGRSSRVADEVRLEQVRRDRVPVLRRISGGAAIVASEGCLFYSLLLSLERRPGLRMLDAAHRFVMEKLVEALRPLRPDVDLNGTSDLVLGDRKFSGNSLRLQRGWMLYHGSLLLSMDLSLIDLYLLHPPREPSYRERRSHADFVTNLHLPAAVVEQQLRVQWEAESEAQLPAEQDVSRLVYDRYEDPHWNLER